MPDSVRLDTAGNPLIHTIRSSLSLGLAEARLPPKISRLEMSCR